MFEPSNIVFNFANVYFIKLSIIIPTYNRPQLLKHAVTSELNNGGNGCEVIVVDDGLEKSAMIPMPFRLNFQNTFHTIEPNRIYIS